jgi:hypothetical protein
MGPVFARSFFLLQRPAGTSGILNLKFEIQRSAARGFVPSFGALVKEGLSSAASAKEDQPGNAANLE